MPALAEGYINLCSDCGLQYGAAVKESEMGRQRYPEESYRSVLSECSILATESPFTTPTPILTQTTSDDGPTATGTPSKCTGHTYVAREGNICESISKERSISTDTLTEGNDMDPFCTGLLSGQELCTQVTCEVMTIEKGMNFEGLVTEETLQPLSLSPGIRKFNSAHHRREKRADIACLRGT